MQARRERIFGDYGMPHIIRSDNGSPFASTGLGGLTRLNVSWIKLGIRPERIAPGHPEQNGRHERMHRELKADTAMPPKANLRSQQRAFDRFRHEYNYERPHQALGQKQPADVYTPSLRPYPRKLPEIVYPRTYTIRTICEGGNLRWCGEKIFIGRALAHEPLGLNEEDDGLWTVHFGPIVLGQIDERKKQTQFIPNKNSQKTKKTPNKPTAL